MNIFAPNFYNGGSCRIPSLSMQVTAMTHTTLNRSFRWCGTSCYLTGWLSVPAGVLLRHCLRAIFGFWIHLKIDAEMNMLKNARKWRPCRACTGMQGEAGWTFWETFVPRQKPMHSHGRFSNSFLNWRVSTKQRCDALFVWLGLVCLAPSQDRLPHRTYPASSLK